MDPAIVSGLSGIGGAVVGAYGGHLADWRLDRKRSGVQAKAAARLLRMELSVRKEQLESAVEELAWWPFYDFTMEPWDRYRDLLAGALDADRWMRVSQSAMELQEFGRGLLKAPRANPNEPWSLSEASTAPLLTMRTNALLAFNALCELADDDEQLSADDPPTPGSTPYARPVAQPPTAQPAS